jgi:oxygen-dependent protoporphyrinogen oxidase
MSELDVLVVGGGISGLAIARCLACSGSAVEVWEREERAGGKIRTTTREGYRLESAASMVVNFRSETDRFLSGAGLDAGRRARAVSARRFVLDADRLRVAPSGAGDLMRSSLFSGLGKLRLLAEPLIPRGSNPHETVAAFVTRRLGREFLEKVLEPYVAGPLASDAELAEARATMPRLVALESRYGSVVLGALLGRAGLRGDAARPEVFSFPGGMATLIESLSTQGGFRVRSGLRVTGMWPVRGGWMVRGAAEGAASTTFARHLVLSTPADVAAGLVEGLDGELARLLRGIEYAPVNVVHTGFDRSGIRHPLNGSGFLVPRNSAFAPTGCLWISNLFPDRAPEGRVLLTTYLGGARNPDAAGLGAARALDTVMRMLGGVLGIRAMPEMVHIETHARALPLYHGAYSQRLSDMDRRLANWPGLHLEASYKGGVSVRDRIQRAELAASRILRLGRGDAREVKTGARRGHGQEIAAVPAAVH